jgi:monothiol glutaredoxin
MLDQKTKEELRAEIEKEISEHKIVFYGKGTREIPMCGFTMETCQFLDRYGYDYTVIDVLHNMAKRELLAEMTNWPTLPKVFINGKFYGDTDILEPMAQNGELQKVFAETFGDDGLGPNNR